jgi:L-asparagine transporter-like permease
VPPPQTTSTASGMCRWLTVRIAQHQLTKQGRTEAQAAVLEFSTWVLVFVITFAVLLIIVVALVLWDVSR